MGARAGLRRGELFQQRLVIDRERGLRGASAAHCRDSLRRNAEFAGHLREGTQCGGVAQLHLRRSRRKRRGVPSPRVSLPLHPSGGQMLVNLPAAVRQSGALILADAADGEVGSVRLDLEAQGREAGSELGAPEDAGRELPIEEAPLLHRAPLLGARAAHDVEKQGMDVELRLTRAAGEVCEAGGDRGLGELLGEATGAVARHGPGLGVSERGCGGLAQAAQHGLARGGVRAGVNR